MKVLVLAIMLAFSVSSFAGPGYIVVANAKNREVKNVVKPAPKKKENGKIQPLDPSRKVPTLKKKYKKD